MIKLMIVDDEPIIREGIQNVIDWESLGIRVVATAANGRDGLARAILEKPDIVITDIRMPIVDGIRFSAELREKFPKIRIIFLTGYEDFEYSRHAIRIGAEDYLLKPVNTEELIELLQKIISEIRKENRKVEIHTREVALVKENLQMMRNVCLKTWFDGKISEEQFVERAGILGLHPEQKDSRIIIFCIDYYFQLFPNGSRESDLMKYALSNIAEEVFGALGQTSACDEGDARLMILVHSTEDTREMVRCAKTVQFNMRKFYGISISVGIGKRVSGYFDLKFSYRNADHALEKRMQRGSSQIITKEEGVTETERPEKLFLSAEEEQQLKDAIACLDRRCAGQILRDIFEHYLVNQNIGRKAAEQFCACLILLAMREADHMHLETEQIFGRNWYYYEEISKYETAEDLELWMESIYADLIRAAEAQKNNKYKGIVTSGIAYAKAHFAESLQVSDVAQKVFVTPNYFSKVFKEETGENFTEWLNKYRIEMAKKRIEKEPETKIYTIAEETGFSDYKYFAFIFKKYTGYTPTTYRNMIV